MLQFCHTQLPIRFSNARLPWTHLGSIRLSQGLLTRQGTHHHAAAACLLDVPIVRLEPRPHGLADVPRGIIPDQQQGSFAFRGQPCRQPGEKLRRHRTDWPPIHKAEEHGPGCPRVTAHNTRRPWARGRAGPARFGSGARASRLSRYGGWAGPSGSTRPHPESPRPSRDAATPSAIRRSRHFFFVRSADQDS